jgi:TonB family protein
MGSAHKEFKAAAVETVRDWSYRPATRQGVPGKMILVVEVSFTLPGTRRR